MPKTTDTRKQKAIELLRMLESGPAFSYDVFPLENPNKPDNEISRSYRIWVNSWIIPIIKELIPELRKKG